MGTDAQNGKAKRKDKPFAIRVVRLLTKAAVATELGPEVCWLLTVVAHTQDARHYAGPVSFWNEQLAPLCGFASLGRLIRARSKAIEDGWLEYQPGGKSHGGRYRVVIPERLQDIPDGPTDESICPSKIEGQTEGNGAFPSKIEIQTEGNARANGKEPRGQTVNILPVPTPEPRPVLEDGTERCEDAPSAPVPSEFVFPLKGDKDWILPQAKLDEYLEAFPDMDVRGELRGLRQWCRDNSAKRKTARGMPAFLTRNLNRKHNEGSYRRNGRQQGQPKTFAQMQVENTKTAAERFIEERRNNASRVT